MKYLREINHKHASKVVANIQNFDYVPSVFELIEICLKLDIINALDEKIYEQTRQSSLARFIKK